MIAGAPIGGPAMFSCFSAGKASWTHEGRGLPENAVIIDDRVLFLKDVQLENAGIYTCEGTSRYDVSFTAKSDLTVYGKSQNI